MRKEKTASSDKTYQELPMTVKTEKYLKGDEFGKSTGNDVVFQGEKENIRLTRN